MPLPITKSKVPGVNSRPQVSSVRAFSAKKGQVWEQNIWRQLPMSPCIAWEQRANDSHFEPQKVKLSKAFPNSENLFAAMNEVVLLDEKLLTLACPLLPVLSWNAGRLQNKSVVFLSGQENKTFSLRNVKCGCRKPSSSDSNKNINGICYGL